MNLPADSILSREAKLNHPRNTYSQLGISRQLFEQKKAAGLCYKCGEKYQLGHQCQNKTLLQICASPMPDQVYDEQLLQLDNEEVILIPKEEGKETGISVHALSGQHLPDTIKVQGEAGGKSLIILINTKSTHSFIDFQIAKKVKANMTATLPLTVTVANGQKVVSKLKCADF